MKNRILIIPLAMAAAIGWSGLDTPATYASTRAQETQSQAAIEHVQIIATTLNSTELRELWYDPNTKYLRRDYREYDKQTRTIKSKRYIDDEEPQKQSLFENSIQYYKSEFWTTLGNAELNGKQVIKKKHISDPKDPSAYSIGYIDPSSGLPVLVETYDDKNQIIATEVHFHDYVNDPTGEIFKVPETDNDLKKDLHKDMGELYSLVLDSYLPIDPGLNSNMQYIAIDFKTLENLDNDDKDYITNYFKKYNVTVLDSDLKTLKATKGMYDSESDVLKGLYLKINKIQFSGQQVTIEGTKYRSGLGAIGIKTLVEFKDGKWQIIKSGMQWIS